MFRTRVPLFQCDFDSMARDPKGPLTSLLKTMRTAIHIDEINLYVDALKKPQSK